MTLSLTDLLISTAIPVLLIVGLELLILREVRRRK
jgi:hypothetical protein